MAEYKTGSGVLNTLQGCAMVKTGSGRSTKINRIKLIQCVIKRATYNKLCHDRLVHATPNWNR